MMMTATDSALPQPPPQPPAHQPVALRCTLTRTAGSPIAAETIDLGATGMRLTSGRPLAVDETVSFDLPFGEARIHGHARVVRQERPLVYALRFDRLTQPMARGVQDIVTELAARA
ncbi:MAG: hypothetical protein QOE11_1386 [Solirubrobacteraceae bacterium]|jgi:hypothetical protein|nr:hypothetical protein [Solirubrobacteraceae bacterium]